MKTMSKWLVITAAAVLITGCNYGAGTFVCSASSECTGGPGGVCEPNGFCSFDDSNCPAPGRRYGSLSGPQAGRCVGEEQQVDAGTNPTNDGPPDAQTCFGTGLLQICLENAPTGSMTPSGTINTDTSSMCAKVKSGGNYCVLAASTISIESKLRATGMRPLVLIASGSITTTATIDVGSHRGVTPETGAGADPTVCAAGTPPGTGAGGAGGSFTGLGGAGGIGGPGAGNPGGTPGAVAGAVTELRGGCSGQDGQGGAADKGLKGHGGGAVFLIAGSSIQIGGGINAAGEGGAGGLGNISGGGGGGAGGMIGFDAPQITCSSLLLATGGGGAEGSDTAANTPGANGSDPSTTAAAGGGTGNNGRGGDGGSGSVASATPGTVGGAGDVSGTNHGGGGGGGGGAGLIKAPITATLGAQVAPTATP